MEDYKEEGYMAGAGNIDEESDALYRNSHKYDPDKRIPHKWTLEELAGRVLVRCEVSRTGLKPFIQQERAFEYYSSGVFHFLEMVSKSSDVSDGKIFVDYKSPEWVRVELTLKATGIVCGSGFIELVEVAE